MDRRGAEAGGECSAREYRGPRSVGGSKLDMKPQKWEK